jgi:biotin carboxyl carrier protein
MPLLTGESLAQRLKARGPLELTEVLRIGMQAAAGLAAAHDQGLVHRDVKPANIFLEKGVERVVITDFGLARAADDVSMTRQGVVAGTPEYMSPEQARGEALDGRSDLFSLACVLYEMATGMSPFRTDSTIATLRRIVDDQPAALTSLVPELPPWFCHIVDRLLSKEPAQRFASASEVSQLLEQCLSHLQQPASVPLPAIVAPLFTGSRSNFDSTRKGAIAILGGIGLTFLAMILWQATEPADISGQWISNEWGTVVLTANGPGEYEGTFTGSVKDQTSKTDAPISGGPADKPNDIDERQETTETLGSGQLEADLDSYGRFDSMTNDPMGAAPLSPDLLKKFNVNAPCEGIVIDVRVEEGQQVKKNQVLIALQSDDLHVEVRNARAEVLEAKAQFEELVNKRSAAAKSLKNDHKAIREIDDEIARIEARLTVALKKVQLLQARIEGLLVRSHVDGIVASMAAKEDMVNRLVRKGDMLLEIQPNKPTPQYRGLEATTGNLHLKWSRLERRFNGTWRKGKGRSGTISLRLINRDIRGGFTTDVDVQLETGTPLVGDLLWKRSQETDGDSLLKKPGKQIGTVLGKPVYEIDLNPKDSTEDNFGRLFLDPLIQDYCQRHKLDRTDELKARIKDGSTRQLVSAFVVRWEFNRHLFEQHGGRVISGALGPVAFDGMRQWLKDQQQAGQFEVTDPKLKARLNELLAEVLPHGKFAEEPDEVKDLFDPADMETFIKRATDNRAVTPEAQSTSGFAGSADTKPRDPVPRQKPKPSTLDRTQPIRVPKPIDRQNARSVVEAYVAAAIAGRFDDAASFVTAEDTSAVRHAEEIASWLDGRRLLVTSVYVNDPEKPVAALATSKPVEPERRQTDAQRECFLVVLTMSKEGWVITFGELVPRSQSEGDQSASAIHPRGGEVNEERKVTGSPKCLEGAARAVLTDRWEHQ